MAITEGELKWGVVKMMDVTGDGVTEMAANPRSNRCVGEERGATVLRAEDVVMDDVTGEALLDRLQELEDSEDIEDVKRIGQESTRRLADVVQELGIDVAP